MARWVASLELRLDRADVDLVDGVLHISKTKFRKDRLVPVHSTTLAALRFYARHRDAAFPVPKDIGFFSQLARQPVVAGRSDCGFRRSLQACRARQWQGIETA